MNKFPLSGEEVDELIKQGLTETDIATQFGVRVSTVHYRRFGRPENPRKGVWLTPSEQAFKLMPWRRIPEGPGGTSSSDYRALKAHSLWQVRHRESDLGADQLRRLISFYTVLITDGLIVEYRPTIPPGTGPAFTRVARTPEDDRLLIRENEWTDLSDHERAEHWSFPTLLPRGAEHLADMLDS